jgi:putative transposase
MPRRARLMVAGMPVHITHRGNNRQDCFYAEGDRAFYLFHLRRLLPHAGCALHAYCLMTNHVHLLLTPATVESCAHLMRGSLWGGRFHSCLVQSEQYLLACYRDVERNPVEAGLCDRPGEYEWSSCRANAHGISDSAAYRELLAHSVPSKTLDEIRAATNGNFALGNEKFTRAVSLALGKRAYRGCRGALRMETHALRTRPISSKTRKTWSVPDLAQSQSRGFRKSVYSSSSAEPGSGFQS